MERLIKRHRSKIGQHLGVMLGVLVGLGTLPTSVNAKDVELKVGIVQRFGEEATDELTLAGTQGDVLTLQFSAQGQPQTIQVGQVKLDVVMQPLKAPVVEEHLVLSDHATFETAEDSANQWKALGIAVEVTQPERWQVWAKRDVYQTPLLRRWLWESLKAQGYTDTYLETEIVTQKPQIVFEVNGNRYAPEQLEVTAAQNLIQVTQENQPHLYGGSLKVQPNAYGTFTLVNQVPLETYLRGVVPHEIGQEAPKTAAEAQAIIARTYALRNLRRFQADQYQLCADVHCQVYLGLTGTNPQADQAIATTQGLVLTYQNELVDALYSSTTGGITAPFSDAWNGQDRPYLRAIIDSPQPVWDLSQRSLADEEAFRRFIALKQGFNETGRTVFRWQKQSKLADLNEDLRKYLEKRKHPLANFQTIEWMKIVERSPSGRILKLVIQTDLGPIELYKTEVRSALGPPRSTLFYIEPIYDQAQTLKGYTFIGGGFGHGVGLSQFGSYNLAKLGWSAEQILSFYYPGTVLQPLNQSIIFWQDK